MRSTSRIPMLTLTLVLMSACGGGAGDPCDEPDGAVTTDGAPADSSPTADASDAPSVLTVSVVPSQAATGVAPTVTPTLTWSRPMDPNRGTLSLHGTRSGAELPHAVQWGGGDTVATVQLDAPLAFCEQVFLTIWDDWQAADGEGHTSVTQTFATQGPPGPVISTDPVDGAVDVSTRAVLTVTYDQPMDPATPPQVELQGYTGSVTAAWVDPYTLSIVADDGFPVTTTIMATVRDVRDVCGVVRPDLVWSFATNDCDPTCDMPQPTTVNSGPLHGVVVPAGDYAIFELDLSDSWLYRVDVTNVSGAPIVAVIPAQSCGCPSRLAGPLLATPHRASGVVPGQDVVLENVLIDSGTSGLHWVVVGPVPLLGDLSASVEITGHPFVCATPQVYTAAVTAQPFTGDLALDAWELGAVTSPCDGNEVTVVPTGGDLEIFTVLDPALCSPALSRDLGVAPAGTPTSVRLVQGEHLLLREAGYPSAPGAITAYDLTVTTSALPNCVDATTAHPWVVRQNNTPGFGQTTYTVTIPANSFHLDLFTPPALAGFCPVLPVAGREDAVIVVDAEALQFTLDAQACPNPESSILWAGTLPGQWDVGTDNGSCGGSCPALGSADAASISGALFSAGSRLFIHLEQGPEPANDALFDTDVEVTIVTRWL